MESLNMNTLASSLPNSVNAEKQLMDNFKAAALSITTLYRSSLDTSKRAYSAGYATCLLDVLHFVQAGVSASGNEGEMTIGRVMDWLEARLEAIKSTEEEEEEEEDRLKEGHAKAAQQEEPQREERRHRKVSAGGTTGPAPPAIPRLHRGSKENLHDAATTTQQLAPPSTRPPSSPPPPTFPFTSPSPPPPPPVRPVKQKLRGLRDLNTGGPPLPADPFPLTTITSSTPHPHPHPHPQPQPHPPFTFSPDVVSVVGSKRRHATMLSESLAASSSVDPSSSPFHIVGHTHPHNTHPPHSHGGGRRKRGRGGPRERERESSSHHGPTGNGNGMQTSSITDTMEVEEEGGRERKRIARR